MRRAAFSNAGGYDPTLRAEAAQGCEDLLLCLAIAETWEFRVVPQYLVGYRITNHNMSAAVLQMLRSCELVLARYRARFPEYRDELDAHLVDMLHWLAIRALVSGQFPEASELLRRLMTTDPRLAVLRLLQLAEGYGRARLVPRRLKLWLGRMSKRRRWTRPLYVEGAW
jgi:hypothetical protein